MRFLSVLTLILITLKLLDKIDWSWWSVMAPMWAGYPLIAIIYVTFVVLATFVTRR